MEKNKPKDVPVTPLNSDDVLKEIKKTGGDAVRTAFVWTLAGLLTQSARSVIANLNRQFSQKR